MNQLSHRIINPSGKTNWNIQKLFRIECHMSVGCPQNLADNFPRRGCEQQRGAELVSDNIVATLINIDEDQSVLEIFH